MSLSIILDAVTVAVAVLFVVIGCRRGFIKSVVRLVGFVAAIVVSAIVSAPVAQLLYDHFLYEPVQQIVLEQVQQGVAAAATTLNEQIMAVIGALPEGVQSLLDMYGVDVAELSGTAVSAEELVPTIMEKIITPLCVGVLQLIVFLVLFIVLFILIRLLGKLLDKIFASLPVIKQANGVLGGLLGFAEAVLVLFVLCFALQLYMTLTGADSLVAVEDIQKTYILRFVMDINPIL